MAEFTFAPLTPASFLDRSAAVFADRIAVIDGERTFTYREMSDRCRRLTGALAAMGVGHEDRVAALCTNSHVMLELHHAVPMRGAALVSVNIRLSPPEMAEIIRHSGASLLVATHEFTDLGSRLAGELDLPLVIAGGSGDDYEAWLTDADPAGAMAGQIDERQLLAINYTTGARTCRPRPWRTTPAWARAPGTCGRCRCSTATAGASPGPSPRPAVPMSACGPSTRLRSGGCCAPRESPTSAPRRPCSP
jgi:fatty-acyl-CoA synthase